jgi:hypothetical protein
MKRIVLCFDGTWGKPGDAERLGAAAALGLPVAAHVRVTVTERLERGEGGHSFST